MPASPQPSAGRSSLRTVRQTFFALRKISQPPKKSHDAPAENPWRRPKTFEIRGNPDRHFPCPSTGHMSCHVAREQSAKQARILTLRPHPLRVALVGQPNVGKSVVFGRLTGRYVTVSNYPGTTVAVTKGRALVGAEVCDVIDTPGVNALEGTLSEDERITRDVVAGGQTDVVIQIADARNLRRALMLTSQLAQFDKPMILALNMVDEALARGIVVDATALQAELGIPVIEMVAVEGRGLAELRDALPRALRPDVPAHRDATDRSAWAHYLTGRVRHISTLSLAQLQET